LDVRSLIQSGPWGLLIWQTVNRNHVPFCKFHSRNKVQKARNLCRRNSIAF